MVEYAECRAFMGMDHGICNFCKHSLKNCPSKFPNGLPKLDNMINMGVNLGAYPPREMDNLVHSILTKDLDKISKKIRKDMENDTQKKAKLLKRKALVEKAEELRDYEKKVTFMSGLNEFEIFRHRTNPERVMYCLTIKGPKIKDKVVAFLNKKQMILPTKLSHFNDIRCVEFYKVFISETDAETFVIMTEDEVYRVKRGILLHNHLNMSTSTAYDRVALVPIDTLKHWKGLGSGHI